MPYGVDTIRLRISFPAAPVSRGYNGRMWRMRPLRGWTGGQAAGAARPEGEGAVPFGSDTTGVQRNQALGDGLALDTRFSPDAQYSHDEASGASLIQQAGLGGRSDAGLFPVGRYQTAADQALAALAAVKALPIGQRFAADAPKANNHVLDVQFTTNYKYACKVLGVDSATAREAIHAAKRRLKLGAREECTFDLKTGDVIWQGDVIGNLFGD